MRGIGQGDQLGRVNRCLSYGADGYRRVLELLEEPHD